MRARVNMLVSEVPEGIWIVQFRYIKIQSKTIDLRTRLWGINTEFVGFVPKSLALRSFVSGWILNISKLVYSRKIQIKNRSVCENAVTGSYRNMGLLQAPCNGLLSYNNTNKNKTIRIGIGEIVWRKLKYHHFKEALELLTRLNTPSCWFKLNQWRILTESLSRCDILYPSYHVQFRRQLGGLFYFTKPLI